jgi:hypothetical protein
MKAGDLVRVNLQCLLPRHRDAADVWDSNRLITAVRRLRLPEGALLLVLEPGGERAGYGTSLVYDPASCITGWIMDAYLDALELAEILTDVEVV